MKSILFGTIVLLSAATAAYALTGAGTSTNPYLIQSREDFNQFINPANSAVFWATGKYAKLTCNLSLAGTTYTTALIAPDTDPLTADHQGTAYSGNFDGDGHKITGLTIQAGSGDFIGLFGKIGFNAVVNNLGLENISVGGESNVGGLAGLHYSGSMSNCYSTGTVSGTANVGGLAGTVDDFSMYGGHDAELTNCYSTCTVRGHTHIGGLIGYIDHGIVSRCYAAGNVGGSGSGSGYHVGGLAGYSVYGFFSNCYAAGTVSGQMYVGGLMGSVHAGNISKCYSIAQVIGFGSAFGGLAGASSNLIYDCFWDIQASGRTTSDGGTGKTTAQMKTRSTYADAGWDFAGVWQWIDFTYPRLNWENVVLGPVAVPNLAGTTEAGVPDALLAAGLSVGSVTYQYSNDVQQDKVISQSPAPGTIVSLGTGVSVIISLGHIYSGGDGTSDNPYKIANAGDLLSIAQHTFSYDKHFILVKDISLAGHTFTAAVIAPDTEASNSAYDGPAFTGVFDGSGRTISGLVINGDDYAGLFGKIDAGGQVKNLAVKDVSIGGDQYVGAVAGWNANLVSGCWSSGAVAANSYAGGLTGVNGGTVSRSYSTTAVSGALYIGGLAGAAGGGTFTECYAAGSVSGTGWCGAIAGNKNMTVYANRCYFLSTSGPNNGIGTPLTAVQMIQQGSFVDWDFRRIWGMPFYKSPPMLLKFPGTFFAQSGDESDPYRISSAAQLTHVAQNAVMYESAFVLTKNIDMAGQSFPAAIIAPDANSVSSGFQGTPFTGVFDGKGYKVFGLAIDGNDYAGLFGQVGSDGQIRDLGVEGSVAGNQYVGALAGDVLQGSVSNCYTVGEVNGANNVGGLAGRNAGAVANCRADGEVSAAGYSVGGLVGNNSGPLTDCRAGARVQGASAVGGLAGGNWSFVTRCYAAATVTGDMFVGGLVGGSYQYTGNIIECYSTGAVSGNGFVGGLVGINKGAVILNGYASGPVAGNYYIGGFVGGNAFDEINYDYGSVAFCFSTGTVSGASNSGGFAGENGINFISNCYFLDSAGPDNNWGEPLAAPQMKMVNSYPGWNFNAVWSVCEQTNVPRLLWQIPAWDLSCPDGCGLEDYAVLARSWQQQDPEVNLAGEDLIDLEDMLVIGQNWLTGR